MNIKEDLIKVVGSVEEYVSVMNRMMNDEEYFKTCSNNSIKRFNENYSVDSIINSINNGSIYVENMIDQQIDWDKEIIPPKNIEYGKKYNKLMMSKQNQLTYDKDSDDGDCYLVEDMKFKSVRCSVGYQPNGNLNI